MLFQFRKSETLTSNSLAIEIKLSLLFIVYVTWAKFSGIITTSLESLSKLF